MVIKRYVHCDICGGKEIEYPDRFASIIPNDGTYSQVSCDSEGLDKSRIKFCLECWCWALQQKFDLQPTNKRKSLLRNIIGEWTKCLDMFFNKRISKRRLT